MYCELISVLRQTGLNRKRYMYVFIQSLQHPGKCNVVAKGAVRHWQGGPCPPWRTNSYVLTIEAHKKTRVAPPGLRKIAKNGGWPPLWKKFWRRPWS